MSGLNDLDGVPPGEVPLDDAPVGEAPLSGIPYRGVAHRGSLLVVLLPGWNYPIMDNLNGKISFSCHF